MRGLGRALGQVLPGPKPLGPKPLGPKPLGPTPLRLTPLGRAVPSAGACVIIFPLCSVQLVGCTWFALFWSWYS